MSAGESCFKAGTAVHGVLEKRILLGNRAFKGDSLSTVGVKNPRPKDVDSLLDIPPAAI
jgi:hypothetical protein